MVNSEQAGRKGQWATGRCMAGQRTRATKELPTWHVPLFETFNIFIFEFPIVGWTRFGFCRSKKAPMWHQPSQAGHLGLGAISFAWSTVGLEL